MDPLTHIVVGRAVVAAADGGARAARGVAAAAILGALAPDIDVAVVFFGWDRYVRFHEVGTHAIAGAVAMACLTAVVVRAVGQFRDRERSGDAECVALRSHMVRPPMPGFGVLLAAATAGAFSHLILDLVSGGRIRLGWPLVQDRITVPLVAMADPWLIAMCVVGLLALWPGRWPLRVVSRAIVGAAIVLLAVKGALLARALRSSPVAAPLPAIQARWGSLTEWYVFDRTATAVRAWRVSAAGGPPALAMSHGMGPDLPEVRASRSLQTVSNFLRVHDFTFWIVSPRNGGERDVLWSDLRYCWPASARMDVERASSGHARAARVEHERTSVGQARSQDDAIACGVWAGGVFDADDRALTQLLKIGSVVQTRPAKP